MFEHFKQELMSFKGYAWRTVRYFAFATALLVISILLGIAGFHWVAELSLQQSMINALSILGTITPPHATVGNGAQIFTALHGVFADTVFLVSVATLMAPTIHRVFHRFHLDG